MEMVEIYHNPRCGKSRSALKYLEEQGIETKIIKYLDNTPTVNGLKEILKRLEFESARELMRTKEPMYKELGLQEVEDEEKLIEAMVMHPKLIERPIVVHGERAVVARPLENIEDVL
jgi:arsenate reductase